VRGLGRDSCVEINRRDDCIYMQDRDEDEMHNFTNLNRMREGFLEICRIARRKTKDLKNENYSET
jgi:hypothetical protein